MYNSKKREKEIIKEMSCNEPNHKPINEVTGSNSFDLFLDAFTELRKATFTFVMSVLPFVCPQRTNRLPH